MDILLNKLDQEAPGLADRLQSLSSATRRSILASACLFVGEKLAASDPALRPLLAALRSHSDLDPGQIACAARLAEAADNRYLELREKNASQIEWRHWFQKARLLMAMSVPFGEPSPKDTARAVYELCYTCDDPSEIIRSIESKIASFAKRFSTLPMLGHWRR